MIKFNELTKKEFRVLPNFKNLQQNAVTIKMCAKRKIDSDLKNRKFIRPSEKHFSYISIDDKFEITAVPSQFIKIINNMIHYGITINNDNIILGDLNVKYYSIDDKGYINTYTNNDSTIEGLKNDIKKIEKKNPYDLNHGYKFTYDLEKVKLGNQYFDKYTNIRYIEDTPIFTGDKNTVIKKYDGLDIYSDINKYKEYIRQECPDVLYDTEITDYINFCKGYTEDEFENDIFN